MKLDKFQFERKDHKVARQYLIIERGYLIIIHYPEARFSVKSINTFNILLKVLFG